MLAAAVLVCSASAVVGEATARTLGLPRWQPTAPAIGLAVLAVFATLTLKLPGHGTTGVLATAALLLMAASVVALRGGAPRPPAYVVALTLLTGLAASVPYISSWRFGIPGVGFNNDLFMHLVWTGTLQDPGAYSALWPTPGYPLGAHSLAGVLSSGTGIDVQSTFAGVIAAIPVLLGWTALSLVDGMSRPRRLLAALLVATAYTVSAFYVQAGFKELLLTLFVVAMVAVARDCARSGWTRPLPHGVALGLLAAGIAYGFSYAGLVWPIAATFVWVGLALVAAAIGGRLRQARSALRSAGRVALAAAGTATLLVLADGSRLFDAFDLFGTSPSGTDVLPVEDVGHLVGAVPKREILGFWPSEDFRRGFESTPLTEVLAIVALVAAVYAFAWWLTRRDLALPAAVAAALGIAFYLSRTESIYVASKALAPAGALTMALSVRALLGRPPWSQATVPRVAIGVAAALFAAGALWSSFLALRGASVGPRDHQDELAEWKPLVTGERTVFLGNDEFVYAMLPNTPIEVRPFDRPEKLVDWNGRFDFDSMPAAALDRVRYAIVPRTLYRSEPPTSFELVDRTRSFELWERQGSTPRRRVLAEGGDPGATLDCSSPEGRVLSHRTGWARVWPIAPRLTRPTGQGRRIGAGEQTLVTIDLAPGRWEISLQYTSSEDLTARLAGRDHELAAMLDRRGSMWRAGEVERRRAGRERIELAVADDPLGADTHLAVVKAIAAVPVDQRPRLVPLRRACGRYVDWYTLGDRPREGRG
jgi:hypothetical protein